MATPSIKSSEHLIVTCVPARWLSTLFHRLKPVVPLLLWAAFLCAGMSAIADEDRPVIRLYLDMDFSSAAASSTAIEQGISTALSEVDNTLAGFRVELAKKDHRGNTRRSRSNLRAYLEDDKALAVFAGLHSPPLLTNREFIHQEKILVLVPWAAAGEITRYPSKENWIFRLSVDDTKAGAFLVRHAVEDRGLRQPALLLEQTGWGHSNEKNMTRALEVHGLHPSAVAWFNWGIREHTARIILRDIVTSSADSILLVANAPEAESIVLAMLSLDREQRLPIISHWGLTGGDFAEVVGPALRQNIDLSFVQTRFSFINHTDDPFGRRVLARAMRRFPESIRSAKDIQAPAGFIHGYDLTRLLIAAVGKAGLSGDIGQDRQKVRDALEQLDTPLKGLIKTYHRPFRPSDPNDPDAHEALSTGDLRMARYREDGAIVVVETRGKE